MFFLEHSVHTLGRFSSETSPLFCIKCRMRAFNVGGKLLTPSINVARLSITFSSELHTTLPVIHHKCENTYTLKTLFSSNKQEYMNRQLQNVQTKCITRIYSFTTR